MSQRKPLVMVAGQVQQLPATDQTTGASIVLLDTAFTGATSVPIGALDVNYRYRFHLWTIPTVGGNGTALLVPSLSSGSQLYTGGVAHPSGNNWSIDNDGLFLVGYPAGNKTHGMGILEPTMADGIRIWSSWGVQCLGSIMYIGTGATDHPFDASTILSLSGATDGYLKIYQEIP